MSRSSVRKRLNRARWLRNMTDIALWIQRDALLIHASLALDGLTIQEVSRED